MADAFDILRGLRQKQDKPEEKKHNKGEDALDRLIRLRREGVISSKNSLPINNTVNNITQEPTSPTSNGDKQVNKPEPTSPTSNGDKQVNKPEPTSPTSNGDKQVNKPEPTSPVDRISQLRKNSSFYQNTADKVKLNKEAVRTAKADLIDKGKVKSFNPSVLTQRIKDLKDKETHNPSNDITPEGEWEDIKKGVVKSDLTFSTNNEKPEPVIKDVGDLPKWYEDKTDDKKDWWLNRKAAIKKILGSEEPTPPKEPSDIKALNTQTPKPTISEPPKQHSAEDVVKSLSKLIGVEKFPNFSKNKRSYEFDEYIKSHGKNIVQDYKFFSNLFKKLSREYRQYRPINVKFHKTFDTEDSFNRLMKGDLAYSTSVEESFIQPHRSEILSSVRFILEAFDIKPLYNNKFEFKFRVIKDENSTKNMNRIMMPNENYYFDPMSYDESKSYTEWQRIKDHAIISSNDLYNKFEKRNYLGSVVGPCNSGELTYSRIVPEQVDKSNTDKIRYGPAYYDIEGHICTNDQLKSKDDLINKIKHILLFNDNSDSMPLKIKVSLMRKVKV